MMGSRFTPASSPWCLESYIFPFGDTAPYKVFLFNMYVASWRMLSHPCKVLHPKVLFHLCLHSNTISGWQLLVTVARVMSNESHGHGSIFTFILSRVSLGLIQ